METVVAVGHLMPNKYLSETSTHSLSERSVGCWPSSCLTILAASLPRGTLDAVYGHGRVATSLGDVCSNSGSTGSPSVSPHEFGTRSSGIGWSQTCRK